MHLFYQPQAELNQLNEEESRHCFKVMRHKVGDSISVLDGKGRRHLAQLTKVGRQCEYHITETYSEPAGAHIVLAVSPTKNTDRIEWLVEKAVEIGVSQLIWLQCQNSERSRLNLERLSKKAVSALKQSKQLFLPEQSELISFSQHIQQSPSDQKFIAYVDEQPRPHLWESIKPKQSVEILIGPEGDFSSTEIEAALQAGYQPVSLGSSRLRTETAALVALHTAVLKLHLSH